MWGFHNGEIWQNIICLEGGIVMKNRFFARIEAVIYAIVILAVWSALIGLVLIEIKGKEYIGIFISIVDIGIDIGRVGRSSSYMTERIFLGI